jgi:hypothetical protein
MAPTFKQNMYQTYKKNTGADALICFVDSNIDFIFSFRDKITEKIQTKRNLYLYKSEGIPTEIDSWFGFFARENEETAKGLLGKKHPGFVAWMFKTKKWKDYKIEEQRIKELVLLEMHTSHDHTCIEIYSSMHSEDSLSELIENIAEELNIAMVKNPKLPVMSDIIMTNKTFDL